MSIGVIYKTISPSGKCYIGQTTKNLNSRRNRHVNDALNKNSLTYNTKFSKAIRKYGKNNFEWSVLYNDIPTKYLNYMEIITIAWHNSFRKGYNSTLGGKGSAGWKHSEKTKLKMSKSRKGKKHSKKTKDKMSIDRKGRKHTEEAKKKMSERFKDIPLSEEHKAKLVDCWTEDKRKALSVSHSGAGNPFYGRKHSKTTKKKISEKAKTKALNWDKVREIRVKYMPYKYTALMLAKEYGVGKQIIYNIINNQTWIE